MCCTGWLLTLFNQLVLDPKFLGFMSRKIEVNVTLLAKIPV